MTTLEHTACLLLGSNIQPERNLVEAVRQLMQKIRILRRSNVWETQPVGSGGPDFLNLALLIATPLEADELKTRVLRPLEILLGRVRGADKNAPRSIDIDIIVFDGQVLDPNLWQYAHRAVPVAEILPDFRSGQGDLLSEVASGLGKAASIRLRSDVHVDENLTAG